MAKDMVCHLLTDYGLLTYFVDIVGRIQVNNLGMCQIPFHAWIFVTLMKANKLVFPVRDKK
jgi:hypothetical protein